MYKKTEMLTNKSGMPVGQGAIALRAWAALLAAMMVTCLVSEVAGQENEKIVQGFEARVNKYLELRKNEAGSAPRPTDSPEKLSGNQRQAAAKVQNRRPSAQGDIFTPQIAAYIRQKIAAALAGPAGANTRASLRHAEPVSGVKLTVNQEYPQGLPLQSMPPTLLQVLPRLPKELEYRIVGRNLVLHDTVPNLVVDFVPDAIPPDKR